VSGTSSLAGSPVKVTLVQGTVSGVGSLSGIPARLLGLLGTVSGYGHLEGEPRNATFNPPPDEVPGAARPLENTLVAVASNPSAPPQVVAVGGATSPSISPAKAARIGPVSGSARKA
jgi:hypothetical protein